ncbi:MAG: TonB-dependent receptor [Chloroherpetonaceae bacterium]|nr:TonB-dependent receptor [Chloroherpetonaceae bacterium]
MKNTVPLFLLVLMLNIPLDAQVGEPKKPVDTLKAFESKEKLVEETRLSQEISSLLPFQELSAKDFMRFSPQSVSDAVRFFRGAFLRDYGGIGGFKTLSLRGLSSNHTMVLYDGIPFTDNQTGQIDLGRLSIQSISKISLSQAGNESLNSPAIALPVSSVLNLESSPLPKKTLFSTGKIQLLVGAFGEKRLGGEIRKSLNDIGQINFSSEYISASGRYTYLSENQTLFERQNSDLQSLRIEAKLFKNRLLSEGKSDYALTAFTFLSDRGLPNAAIIGNEENSAQRLKNIDSFLQFNYSHDVFTDALLKLSGKAEFHQTLFRDPNALVTGGVDDRYNLIGLYGGGSLSKTLFSMNGISAVEASLSADWLENFLSTTLPEFDQINRSQATLGIIVQSRFDRLDFITSLSFQSLSDRRTETEITASHTSLFQAFAYSLSLGYTIPTTTLKISATYSRNLRLPSINERYFTRVGNPNLRPEIAGQLNLGIRYALAYQPAKLDFETYIDGYLINSDDKIISIPRDAFNWSVQNVGQSLSTGIETGIRLRVFPLELFESEIEINYSYQSVKDKTENSPTFNSQLPYIPFHSFNLRLFLKYQNFSLHSSVSQSGYRFSLPENSQSNFLPSYSLFDITLSYEFVTEFLKHKLITDIRNVFSENYVIIRSFPMPPRNARIIYELSF